MDFKLQHDLKVTSKSWQWRCSIIYMPVMHGLAGAETVLRLECCSIRAGLCTETLRLMSIALYYVRLRVVIIQVRNRI
jgi:hypothetical protein